MLKKSLRSFYTKILNNGTRGIESVELARRVQLMNSTVAIITLGLVLWTIIEIFLTGNISYQLFKIFGIIYGLKFVLWYRKKTNADLQGSIIAGIVTCSLLIIHLLNSFSSTSLVFLYLIPPYVFMINGIVSGLVWSGIVLIWLVMTVFLSELQWVNYSVSSYDAVAIIISYVIIVFISLSYERIRYQMEQGFISKNEELTRFIYVISHDIRNPLTSIKGFTSFLKDDIAEGDSERVNHDISRMEQVISSMESLITDLLNLSRIGRDVETTEEFDAKESIDRVLLDNESQLETAGIAVETSGVFPRIITNRRKFEEIVRNLMTNAIKYIGTPEQPKITIGVIENAFDYQFYVQDNGIGISPEFHNRIFEAFYQRDTTNQEGSGIGLAVVKGFINDLGGNIWVESQEGQGSTFRFSIPRKFKN